MEADSDLTMGPGWHHGITGTSQCSHSSDLTAPRRPTDKLKAVSNLGIPIFHISLF